MIDQFNDNAEILQRIGAGSDFIVRLSLCAPGDAVTAARGEIYADYGEPYRFEWPAEGVTKAGDALVVAVDGHRLQRGRLRVRLEADMPDTAMPDGVRTIGYRGDLPAEICKDGDALGVEAEIPIPVVVATAYAIAAANGYGGTEAEYNAALTAMPGAVAAANEAAGLAGEAAELAAAAAIGARDSAQAANSAAASASEAAGAAERVAEAAGRAAGDCWDSAADAAAAANAANAASEAANAAEALRATAESARAQAEAERQQAEQQRAQQAIANAEAAAAANAAALLAQQAAAEAPTPRVERIERDFAQYEELPPIQLVAAQTGKAVGASGAVENRAGYAVSELVRLRKGNTYLYRPANGQPIAAGVALCARYAREDTAALIDYAYAYNEDGSIATATAMHDPSLAYAYDYGEGGELLGISIGGERVAELPQYRVVEAGSFAPMFASLSDDMPRSGYYAILCNEDCEAAFSAPAPLGEALAVSYGVIRSLANQKEDKAVVKQLKERVAELEAEQDARHWERIDMLRSLDGQHWTYLCPAGAEVGGKTYDRDTWVTSAEKPAGFAQVTACAQVPAVIISFQGLFYKCSAIKECDVLVDYDNTIPETISDAFFECSSLTHFDGSKWKTSNVTKMKSVFEKCYSLKSLNLSGWVSPSVTTLERMLEDCSSLESLNISGWDTSSVTLMNRLFNRCYSLTSDDIESVGGWDVSNVTNMSSMFEGCSSLAVLDLSEWNTPSVTLTERMFNGCSSLAELDPSGWDVSNVTSMSSMFNGCSSLAELDLSGWNTSSVTNFRETFKYCSSLRSLDLSTWNPENAAQVREMFYECHLLESLDLSGFNVKGCDSFYGVFYKCFALRSVDVSGWDLRLGQYVLSMFSFCDALRYVAMSPCFFTTRLAISFSLQSMGLADGNADSNGWLEMLAETAPTIRLAADWDEEAWQADKLEENPDTPKLLTEEGGEWYLNDGVGRTIQLHANLKNKAWAQPLIAQLVKKGYTVA